MYLSQVDGFRNEKLLKVIGYTLRNQRKMSGFTQKRLSEEAFLSANYIRDIEYGKKAVSVEILYRICTTLGIGITDFFQQVEQLMSEEKIIFLK